MRLQKLPDGTVRLSRLNPWEVQTFRSLPALADFSGHAAAERRLLPSPAVEEDLTPEMGMDWVEYVIPELRDSFARSLGTVMADLENLKVQPPDAREPAPRKEKRGSEKQDPPSGQESGEAGKKSRPAEKRKADDSGPGGEAEAFPENAPGGAESSGEWSVDIPAAHAEHWFRAMNQARLVLSARHGIDSEHLPDLASLLTSGRLEHWFQYELFVSLQGWLVEAVLDEG